MRMKYINIFKVLAHNKHYVSTSFWRHQLFPEFLSNSGGSPPYEMGSSGMILKIKDAGPHPRPMALESLGQGAGMNSLSNI